MGHSIRDVVDRDMCIGCGACSVRTGGAVPITISPSGIYTADLSALDDSTIHEASRVCPFSDDSRTEDELAESRFPDLKHHDKVGHYRGIYAGRVTSEDELMKSSSGGVTTWLLAAAIESGHIDGVIHVGASETESLYEYTISRTPDEVSSRRKSMYYATNMAGVLGQLATSDGRYALVGVPCFITAARHLCDEMPQYADRLVMFVGIVCGHLKSQFFAESLGWQAGVAPTDLQNLEFRVKNPHRPAMSYDYRATPRQGSPVTRSTAETIDGVWGYGAFQPEACNFCDDVFAETADVVLGDAWLPEYQSDWRGTSIIATRSRQLDELVQRGKQHGELDLDAIEPETAARSQAGNFRHRRDGLRVRLADDIGAGLSTPTKRVRPGYDHVPTKRAELIRQRRSMSRLSIRAFSEARSRGELSIYIKALRPEIRAYRKLDRNFVRRSLSTGKLVAVRLRNSLLRSIGRT